MARLVARTGSAGRRVLVGAVLLAATCTGVPARAASLPSGLRCVAVDFAKQSCSYEATGTGLFVAAHYGPWELVIRDIDGDVRYQRGESGPNTGVIPSNPGEDVELKILQPGASFCPYIGPPVGQRAPRCTAGPLLAFEPR